MYVCIYKETYYEGLTQVTVEAEEFPSLLSVSTRLKKASRDGSSPNLKI
jgi:hypothetical protein